MTNNVFISGATSGIGCVTAKLLDAMGWRVFAADLPDDDFTSLDTTSDKLVNCPLDITDPTAVADTAQQIAKTVGDDGLQAIVNNAGIQITGVLETLPLDQLRQQFEVNVFGHLQVTQILLPLLRKSSTSRRIVNVSSLMGKVAMPTLGAYSMSKHALEAMTDVLRLELAQWNIHVTAIEMGAIQTPMTDSMEAILQQAKAHQPNTDYDSLYNSMTDALRVQNKNATPPEDVAKVIIHALTSPKPKTRYVVGAATKGLIAMRKLAPDTVGDAILKRALGISTAPETN